MPNEVSDLMLSLIFASALLIAQGTHKHKPGIVKLDKIAAQFEVVRMFNLHQQNA